MNLQYISLLISASILGILFFMKTKKNNFGIRVLTAMIFGVAVGIILKNNALIIEPLGTIYVNLIKMLVIPLVMASLISSITTLDNTEKLKRISFKSLGFLIATTVLATGIGLIVGKVMNLGSGMQFVKDAAFKAKEVPKFSSVIVDMFPINPISDMANAKMIPVIIFSILVAVAINVEGTKQPEAVKPVKDFISSFSKIMFSLTRMIIELTPYGVYGLMVPVAAKYGVASLLPLGKFILAMYIGCLIHIALVHGSLIALIAKVNPIKFFTKISEALVVAFTTRSSYGTLPITIRVLTEKVKVSDRIASFTASLGASIGMNGGGGVYPTLVAIFVARLFNIELTFAHYILLFVTAAISSIGIAGVPGAATISATVVLSSLGLPVEGLAMILGIDVVVDMIRTMTNVTGAAVASILVASTENELDVDAFNKSDVKNELTVA
ncbi:dicarboxylate/amino acid:cation symporter [Clostridium omnivorum]|uniref:Amino acid:proton symporter n=1 Tax=Clostridium omnivorum TaxID=1604902 RepID=A0ABQ5N1S9_9CLOT|nr:dicarboxylate/amino acid:cation symporter [Clostridium sp. E14]GLC29149.1 amino acid:proton symporter [Clostridium sp. E14]